MPAAEIKALKVAGKLDEAYALASAELLAEPENIWTKRNMSWVLYAQLGSMSDNLTAFIEKLQEVKSLQLPETEEMFYDTVSVVLAKAARNITSNTDLDLNKLHNLFDEIKDLPLQKHTLWYSVLYQALHKGMKTSPRYIEFADWWNFENFRKEDFETEKMDDGKEIMALSEQAYISYAKKLLPVYSWDGQKNFSREKVVAFLPRLNSIIENYPQYQYPGYFKAKLLLALGDTDNMLSALLPFAKKKQNDFWVWEIFAEAFKDDPEKVLSCYCRALLCNSPEEMLVNLRKKMAGILISRKLYNEAKTEIDRIVNIKKKQDLKISKEIVDWMAAQWYNNATNLKSNKRLYESYKQNAEELLYSDIKEETIIVDSVNSERRILNFIASEVKVGFFKYDRIITSAKIGDVLKVRFQPGSRDGFFKIYTGRKVEDAEFKSRFVKEINGTVRIPMGKTYGFLEDAFIHPTVVTKMKLEDGMLLNAVAQKSFNMDKNTLGWKVLELKKTHLGT